MTWHGESEKQKTIRRSMNVDEAWNKCSCYVNTEQGSQLSGGSGTMATTIEVYWEAEGSGEWK